MSLIWKYTQLAYNQVMLWLSKLYQKMQEFEWFTSFQTQLLVWWNTFIAQYVL